MRATGAREPLAFEVPATANVLANRLTIALVLASPSETADALTRLRSAHRTSVVLVHGEEPGFTVATLQTALHAVRVNAAVVQLPVCVAGLDMSHATLRATAQRAGISLVAGSLP